MESKLTILKWRLDKIGISVTYVGNYPWIYVDTINGKRVTERYQANHGFTIAWYGEPDVKFTDLKEIFNLIRRYKDGQD